MTVQKGVMSMRTKLVVALILLPMVLISTNSSAQSGRSWMKGFVVESDTNGIAAATVELIGDQDNARLRSVKLTAQTDATGKYSLEDVPYGEYTFRVSAPGFITYQIQLYVLSDTLTQLHAKLKKQK
jgi:hypothetical protein